MSPTTKGPGFVDGARVVMHALFEGSRALDIRNFEESSSAEVARDLSPQVIALVERAIGVASNILARYENESGAVPSGEHDSNFDLAVDTLLAATGETKVAVTRWPISPSWRWPSCGSAWAG